MAKLNKKLKLTIAATAKAPYWGWTDLDTYNMFKGKVQRIQFERAVFLYKNVIDGQIVCEELGIKGYFAQNEIQTLFYEVSTNYGAVWRNLIKN